jgi:hypothetical protein
MQTLNYSRAASIGVTLSIRLSRLDQCAPIATNYAGCPVSYDPVLSTSSQRGTSGISSDTGFAQIPSLHTVRHKEPWFLGSNLSGVECHPTPDAKQRALASGGAEAGGGH